MAAAKLVEAAADHGVDAVNMHRIALCEQSSDVKPYQLAIEALLQTRDLLATHSHAGHGCRVADGNRFLPEQ